jgi:hypothetical protein
MNDDASYERSEELRAEIEHRLAELAGVIGNYATVGYVERIAERMREELEDEPS